MPLNQDVVNGTVDGLVLYPDFLRPSSLPRQGNIDKYEFAIRTKRGLCDSTPTLTGSKGMVHKNPERDSRRLATRLETESRDEASCTILYIALGIVSTSTTECIETQGHGTSEPKPDKVLLD